MHKVHFDRVKSPVLANIWDILKEVDYSVYEFGQKVDDDRKFNKLGSGSYAKVYEHEDLPGLAIRVGSSSGYGCGEHKKYVDISRRSTGQITPKYYYFADYTSRDGWDEVEETTVTVMEQLRDIYWDSKYRNYRDFINGYDCTMERYFSGYNSYNEEMREVRRKLGWNGRSTYNLRRQVVRAGLSFNDMHAGNILVRDTPRGPQFVITDPVA